MKWLKNICINLTITSCLIGFMGQQVKVLDTNAIGTAKDDWVEEVDPENYDTWRQDIKTEFEISSWLDTHLNKKSEDISSNINNLYLYPAKGMEAPTKKGENYTVRRWGSLLYSVSKLLVSTGTVDEYSSTNPEGINPGILYFASILTTFEEEDSIQIGIDEKNSKPDKNGDRDIYTSDVPAWTQDPTRLMDTIAYYWGKDVTLDETVSITKSKDDNKKEYIKGLLDDGKYVILSVRPYKYWDEDNGSVVNGHQSAYHHILLTGYKDTVNGEFDDFTMDDSLSPATYFKDVYSYKDIEKVSVFTVSSAMESRLEFYQGKVAEEPWYLKLVSKEKPVEENYSINIPLKQIIFDDSFTVKDITEAVDIDKSGNGESKYGIDKDFEYDSDPDSIYVDERMIKDLRDKMLFDMIYEVDKEEAGNLYIEHGYRTFKEQSKLYSKGTEEYGEAVDKYVPDAGQSEHNIGIAVDFIIDGVDDFSQSDTFKWLCKNAFKYGFILRYPGNDVAMETTGRAFDACHWRYIGKQDAIDFMKFIEAQYKEDEDGNITDVEAYINAGYNGKVYEDYYLEVVVPKYTGKDTSDMDSVSDLDEDTTKKPKYSDATLRRVYYMLRHPVKSIGNLFSGLAQMAHNAIAVGKTGNLFNLSWIMDWDMISNLLKPYMIISTCVIVIALLLRWLRYMVKLKDNTTAIIRDSLLYISVGTVPIILLSFVGNCFDGLTNIITRDVTGKIVMIETAYDSAVEEEDNEIEITLYELLSDEKLSRDLFRETFIDDSKGSSYEFATIKMPIGYDEVTGKLINRNVSVRELYDTVSWENYVDNMVGVRSMSSYSQDDYIFGDKTKDLPNSPESDVTVFETTKGLTMKDVESANMSQHIPRYLYYSCNEFVPVHYDYYDDSIFYYFYDWIKYQYLSYWAYNSKGNGEVISNFAQRYVLPGEDFDPTVFGVLDEMRLDDEDIYHYQDRIKLLEESYLSNTYLGVHLMYEDSRYTRSNTDYYNDLFGLSYLFKMTADETEDNYAMVDDFYKDSASLEVWAKASKVNYLNTMPDYDDFRTMVSEGDYKYINIQPLTNIVNGPAWNVYKNSKYLKGATMYNNMKAWSFTPTFLAEWFEQDLDTPVKKNSNGRIPWRLYASHAQLSQAYGDKNVEWTRLEQKLCELNEDIFHDVYDISNYMPGQVTDDTMIFVVALAATSRFNEVFSSMTNKVYPIGIEKEDLDMDKMMKLTYADELVNNSSLDTMYMIYDSPGGLAVVLIVLLSELFILAASATRAVILVMFFIGTCLLTLNFYRNKMPTSSNLLTGVIWQLVSLVLMHCLMVGANMAIFNLLVQQESAGMRIIISLLGMFIYAVIAVVNIAMMMIFMKDIKNYGGLKIKNAIQIVNNEIAMAEAEESRKAIDTSIDSAELRLNKTRDRRKENMSKLDDRRRNRIYTKHIKEMQDEENKIERDNYRSSKRTLKLAKRNIRGTIRKNKDKNNKRK